MQDLSDESKQLPDQLWIPRDQVAIGRYYTCGAQAAISRGRYRDTDVAIREVAVAQWDPETRNTIIQVSFRLSLEVKLLHQTTRREVLIHHQLQHPNVIGLLGVFEDNERGIISVLPFLQSGIQAHVKKYPNDRWGIVRSITCTFPS